MVGEVRRGGASAAQSWNTGHPGGLATVHATSAVASLVRLEQLIQEANVPPQPQLIAEVVDLLVSIARTAHGRRIAVDGYSTVGGYGVTTLEPKLVRLEPSIAA